MSGTPLTWGKNLPPAAAARGREKGKAIADSLTFTGVSLFIIGLLIATSAFSRFRVNIGVLHVHLYLFVMAPFFAYLLLNKYHILPAAAMSALVVFLGMYSLATLSGKEAISEMLKILASGVTIVTAALMVRSTTDFRAGVLGLTICIGFLAFFNLETADKTAVAQNVMETGNKNAYSLYALPAMLLAGFLLVEKKSSSSLIKGVLLTCTFGSVLVIFMGANRSGYAGCALVALMLMVLRGFNLRGALLVAALGYAAFFAISRSGGGDTFEWRMQQTAMGTRSDTIRKSLVQTAVEVGLENPIVGVSPQGLPLELGSRLGLGLSAPHNVIGQLVGGTGLICSAALVVFGILLWRLKPKPPNLPISADFKKARTVLRMMLVLWVFRGQFTGDIVYSPSFSLGIGLLIGLCLTIERQDQIRAQQQAALPPGGLPGGRPLRTGIPR